MSTGYFCYIHGGWWYRTGVKLEESLKVVVFTVSFSLSPNVCTSNLQQHGKNIFLILLLPSFLILPLQIPWNDSSFPTDCWLELLGKKPFHPNKPTEQEGYTAVTSRLQIHAAHVSYLMRKVSSSVLLFRIETVVGFFLFDGVLSTDWKVISESQRQKVTSEQSESYFYGFVHNLLCIGISCSLIAKVP